MCVQRVRHDVYAWHQARRRVDRRGKHVAQPQRHGADQHVFVSKSIGRYLAAQHVDVGVAGPLRDSAGVGNALVLLLHPRLGQRAGASGRWGAALRQCGASGALQRHTQMRPRCAVRAFLQKQVAHYAIVAQRDMHVAQRGGGIGQQRQRQVGLRRVCAIGCTVAALHHWQHGAASGA